MIMNQHLHILVPQNTKENGDCERIQSHGATFYGRVRYTSGLFTFHFCIQKLDHRVQKFGTMSCDIVSKPLVEVEILSPRRQSGNIKGKVKRLDIKKRI
jgi:hypothetical protein